MLRVGDVVGGHMAMACSVLKLATVPVLDFQLLTMTGQPVMKIHGPSHFTSPCCNSQSAVAKLLPSLSVIVTIISFLKNGEPVQPRKRKIKICHR
jgi:hypothetical protein